MRAVVKSEPETQSGATAALAVAESTPDVGERLGSIGTATTEPMDGRVARAQRLRHERSTQLLSVARRLFAERGYHKTSIQDILDTAGVARGTLYLHFDGKRAMFDALVDAASRLLDRCRAAGVPDTAPGLLGAASSLMGLLSPRWR